MSAETSAKQDPTTALRTFVRVALNEIISVVVLSVLFVIACLSLVTIGAAMISLVDTIYTSVTFTGTGGGIPPRTADRANYFVKQIWEYLWTGLLYTVVLILAAANLYGFFRLAFLGGNVASLLVGVAGLYLTTVILVVLFRAANIIVHADEDDRPGAIGGLRLAWSSMTDNVGYEALHVVVAATIVLVARSIPVAMIVVLPGLLALLEVLMYEELEGIGAEAILFAYTDPND